MKSKFLILIFIIFFAASVKSAMREPYFVKLKASKIFNISKTQTADLNSNSEEETYTLKYGALIISENKKIIWKSPDNFWVSDFLIADSNNDGILDLNLSIWKKGSFGKSKPFWIKQNTISVRNHFLIYDLKDEKIIPVWHSSDLLRPNCKIYIYDADRDGKNELAAIEGDYNDLKNCDNEKKTSFWKWNEWGFEKLPI